MGSSSSSATSSAAGDRAEGDHLFRITESARRTSVLTKNKDDATAESDKGSSNAAITYRARILKLVSHEALWSNFLESPASSFALTFTETSALLTDSIKKSTNSDLEGMKPYDSAAIKEAVKSYLELVKELNGSAASSSASVIDFMSLCSSVLLLSNVPIEMKVDKLFEWITMGEGEDSFEFDEFYVALNSFEKGMSTSVKISYYKLFSNYTALLKIHYPYNVYDMLSGLTMNSLSFIIYLYTNRK